MKISIVTTLYYSQNYVNEFYNRISATVRKITNDFEVIFVNDGSPDNSLEVAKTVHNQNDNVIIIDLSKNFGHHRAMMTGLKFAKGDYVFMIDIDLEEKPELIEKYWEAINSNNDIDVVYGSVIRRKGKLFERVSGWISYKLINYFSGEKMPENYSFSRLMKKEYVLSLLDYSERELYIGGLWYTVGYNQMSIPIEKTHKGSSTYSLSRKMSLFITSIVSFSSKPLYLMFVFGCVLSSLAFILSVIFMLRKVFTEYILTGWTSVMLSIWFLSGVNFLFLGVIGIYLSKVYIETKQRPYSTIKRIYKN